MARVGALSSGAGCPVPSVGCPPHPSRATPVFTPSALLDVDRHLSHLKASEISDDNLESLLEMLELGVHASATWDDLLKHRVTLLVGRANTGKSSELLLLQDRLRSRGQVAFLLDIKAIYREPDIGLLLDAGGMASFVAWQDSSEAEAVFLLDAADEAQLFERDAFDRALRVLRRSLTDGQRSRARWVVSTRPGGWHSTDALQTIASELGPAPRSTSAAPSPASPRFAIDAGEMAVASLRPLTDTQAARLLGEAYGVDYPERALSIAHDLGLDFATNTPGDLKWLAEVSKSPGPVHSRTEALAIASARLIGYRKDTADVPDNELVAEVEGLCAASVMCEANVFVLRRAPPQADGLPLTDLLAHRSRDIEDTMRAIPLMTDAGFQRIKIVPERLQHFLAARWFARRASSDPEQAALLDLFRRESMAGPLVPWQRLTVAGWLSSMCPRFREKLLEFAPHAVLLMSDLAKVDRQQAAEALDRTCDLMAAGHPLVPTSLRLTRDDFWQAAHPDLHDAALRNLEKHAGSELCGVLLLRIAERIASPKAMPALRGFFAEDRRPRVLEFWLDAIESCGTLQDVAWAVKELAGLASRLPARLLSDACCALVRAGGPADLLVDICSRLPRQALAKRFDVTTAAREAGDQRGIRYANALLDASPVPTFLPGEHDDEDIDDDGEQEGNPGDIGIVFARALLKGVLEQPSIPSTANQEVLDALDRIQVLPPKHAGYKHMEGFPDLVKRHATLQDAALRRVVPRLGDDVYMLRPGSDYFYVSIDGASMGTLERIRSEVAHPEALKAIEQLAGWLEAPVRTEDDEAPPDPPTTARRSTSSVERFEGRLDELRQASPPALLHRAVRQASGSAGRTLSRADWEVFRSRHGSDVFEAVRAGLRRLWRSQPPECNEAATHEVYASTVTGLAALDLELDSQAAATDLQPDEVRRALEYAPFELNQLPRWFRHLQSAWPQEVEDFLVARIGRWAATAMAKEHARKLIRHLDRESIPPSRPVKHAIRATIKAGAWSTQDEIEAALDLLAKDAEQEDVGYVIGNSELAWTQGEGNFAAWFTVALALDPQGRLRWLEAQQESDDFGKRMIGLSSYWRYDKALPFHLPGRPDAERVGILERMYLVLARTFRHQDDRERIGSFTPDARDHAEHLRDRVLSMLAAVGGSPAYEALQRLATRDDVGEDEMRWLHGLAFAVADEDAKAPPWTTQEFLDYSRRKTTPLQDALSLWVAVRQDVDEVIRNLMEGKFSPRSLLQAAKERDMQLWMSRELELLARARYGVEREPELADGTTPDLVVQSPAGHEVALELKLGDKRSKASLLSDLRRQLHDDYLKRRGSDHGIFVVMWREEKDWSMRPAKRARVQEAADALQTAAAELVAASNGVKQVAVRCFTCPLPVSPRNEKKLRSGVRTGGIPAGASATGDRPGR